ncbi:MAG TPA: NAD(+) kinase [Clostridiales bacterium]|nr:NAD(+) kinase [Clostridiales bacterium]
MRIGLYANPVKDTAFKVTREAASLIRQHGAISVVGPEYRDTALCSDGLAEQNDYATCDIIICLGGDGTFLSMVHQTGCENIPFVGVNLGSVGFLPEILPDRIRLDDAIRRLVSGNYHVEERMMLEVSCYNASHQLLEFGCALNDAVISRGGSAKILTLDLTINDDYIDMIPGDGLIVSTPTGSTAYSLSAGGPIIQPELSLLLITPICPHTLHNRSFIAADTSSVLVRICDYPGQALVAIDGREDIYVESGSTVEIRKSPRTLKLIRLGKDNFYAVLSQKIQARGRTR